MSLVNPFPFIPLLDPIAFIVAFDSASLSFDDFPTARIPRPMLRLMELSTPLTPVVDELREAEQGIETKLFRYVRAIRE